MKLSLMANNRDKNGYLQPPTALAIKLARRNDRYKFLLEDLRFPFRRGNRRNGGAREPRGMDETQPLWVDTKTSADELIITRPDGDLPDVTFPALSDDANVKILRKLVSHGPNIEHRHREGGTLLHWAVRSRDERTVALLLARDSRVAVDARTRDGRTPLRLAVDTYTWSPDIIRGLLDRGADVNAADAKGVTPFLVALRMHGVTDVPHWLIEKGADVTARGALELAAEADPRYLARILDNLDLATNRGSFLELFRSGGQEAVRMLFDHGFTLAPEDAKDIELLHAALRLNQRRVVEDLVSWGAIAMAPPGVTRDLLARAIDSANLTAIEWLFGIDEGLSSGFALEKAIVARNASVVETVLRVGDLRLAGVFEGVALESLEDLEVEDADELREVICRHVVLVATAGLEINQGCPQYRKDELPEWVSESVPASFLVECVAEVAFLRTLRVGDSSATFYDVLNASSAGMARLLKDPVVRGTLESRSFATEFPRFWPLVDARVRSGGRRRDLVDRGVEGFGSLAPQCHRLPFHLRERIFGYLRNHELLVLIEACRLGKGENDTDPR
ncbi:unnamed protein product [Bemisia tabaci]|uniref:Ankyrin n=1 Tax=Bemisia tabaci TaxID=7038 RepID=A0A9P0F260_BEMTA|nr:unnamed protein product [Bemisia tabaci]